jgi:Fic family protein/very-short-patch-repair endonuclease
MRKTNAYKSLPYNPALKDKAKALRKAGILHEALLWLELKSNKLNGLDFDRQKIIGNYIVDFYCAEKSVVIEVDGSSHDGKQAQDAKRDAYLNDLGLTVIRVLAKDVLQNMDGVVVFLRNHPALRAPLQRRGIIPPFGHPSRGGELSRPSGTPPEEGNYPALRAPLRGRGMMRYKPPFTLTSEILNLVAEISQQVGELNASQLNASSQLRKQNRIKTITGTLAIEGNTLTEEQVTAIVEGKPVLGSMRELAEVKGAIAAYDALPTFTPSAIDDLLTAHGLMLSDIFANAGEFRSKGVGIHKGGVVHHVTPPAHQVSGLMTDLIQWLKQTKDHPLIASCVFHYEFEFIHPFADGNGRMGRLWQTLILSKWQPIFINIPVESLVHQHQEAYYLAIRNSTAQTDCSPFIRYMLQMILDAIEDSTSRQLENAGISAGINAGLKLSPLDHAILELIKADRYITNAMLAEQTGKALSTIERRIKKMKEHLFLKRVGAKKTGHWEVHS